MTPCYDQCEWFPEDLPASRRADAEEYAVGVCNSICPFREACLAVAMRHEAGLPARMRHGIWGGTLPQERADADPALAHQSLVCERCGEPFPATFREGRPRRFCSRKCQMAHYNDGYRADGRKRREKIGTVPCTICGAEMSAVGGRRYCSDACKNAARRIKRNMDAQRPSAAIEDPADPRHGSHAGRVAHWRAGVPMCDRCRQSSNDYQRRKRERKRVAA